MVKLGFDNIVIRPNQKISRYLAKRFFIERGNPKFIGRLLRKLFYGYSNKIQNSINFYAEHGESEYGGLVLNKNSLKRKIIQK